MIPDSMPTLSAGSHSPSEGRACVMEYVALIKGVEWTDTPRCTDPYIAELAISLNDSIEDNDERSRTLVPLIGKIMACAPTESGRVGSMSMNLVQHELKRRETVFLDDVEVPLSVRAALFERVLDLYLDAIGVTPEPVTPATLAEAEAKVLAVL